MFCSKCGKRINPETINCPFCGSAVIKSAPSAMPGYVYPPTPNPSVQPQSDIPGSQYDTTFTAKRMLKKKPLKGWAIALIAIAALAFLFSLTLAVRSYVFEIIRVDGDAMMPELRDGMHVSVNKTAYWFAEPDRGDIVMCHFPDSPDTFIKRVIGLEGDRIRITDGVLYINDVANNEYYTGVMNSDMDEITVPEDHVFVMGDNRNNSIDSAKPYVGPLPYKQVLGKIASSD